MLAVHCAVFARLSGFIGDFRINPLYRVHAGERLLFDLHFLPPSICNDTRLVFVGASLEFEASCISLEYGTTEVNLSKAGSAQLIFESISVLRLDISASQLSLELSEFIIPRYAQANAPVAVNLLLRDEFDNEISHLCSAGAIQLATSVPYVIAHVKRDGGVCTLDVIFRSLLSTETVLIIAESFGTAIGREDHLTLTYGGSNLLWVNCLTAVLLFAIAVGLGLKIYISAHQRTRQRAPRLLDETTSVSQ